MINIVHIVPDDGIGGVEAAARSQAARPRQGFNFQLIFIAPRNGSRGGSLNPLAHWRSFNKARRERPDIIIFSLWKSVPVALLLKLFLPRSAFVFTLNNETTTHFLDAAVSALGIMVADEVWADSRRSLDSRLAGRRKTARVISFMIDRLDPPDRRCKLGYHFVSWGRLSTQKGIDIAIGLLARMVERGHDARFDIWGPDDGENLRLSHLIASLSLDDRIELKGPIDRRQLSAVAEQATFFLQLSRFEGLAMACVEAMQLGLVPVTTPVGAMADYVVPGKTGIIVDPEKIDAAIDEIVALLAKPESYDRLRDGAIARWHNIPVYADDMFNACADAYARLRPAASVR